MKDLQILEQKVAEMQAEIERLKATPNPLIERASDGEPYWVVDKDYKCFKSREDGDRFDQDRYDCFNYYTDENLCKQVADYYKRTALFTRKAIEFSKGYEFKEGENNCYVIFNHRMGVYAYSASYVEESSTIYMKETQAGRFKEWCNENKEALGVCAL